MNVDSMAIAVRERSLSELYDLTGLLLRTHGLGLMRLMIPVIGLLVLVNWWALDG